MSNPVQHAKRVRMLYKALLKLHRGLPYELKAIGDAYVKEEFRLHKNISLAEGREFMEEWTKYYVIIAKQMSQKKKDKTFGLNLSGEALECFNEEQIVQLYELMKETTKPREQPSDS